MEKKQKKEERRQQISKWKKQQAIRKKRQAKKLEAQRQAILGQLRRDSSRNQKGSDTHTVDQNMQTDDLGLDPNVPLIIPFHP